MAYAVKGIRIPPLSATPVSLKGATFSTADQDTLYSRKGICIQLPAVIPPAGGGVED